MDGVNQSIRCLLSPIPQASTHTMQSAVSARQHAEGPSEVVFPLLWEEPSEVLFPFGSHPSMPALAWSEQNSSTDCSFVQERQSAVIARQHIFGGCVVVEFVRLEAAFAPSSGEGHPSVPAFVSSPQNSSLCRISEAEIRGGKGKERKKNAETHPRSDSWCMRGTSQSEREQKYE